MRFRGSQKLFLILVGLQLAGAGFQQPVISSQDNLEISGFYNSQTREIVNRELAILGYKNLDFSVGIKLDFDQGKLDADEKLWMETQRKEQTLALEEAVKRTKDNFRELLREALDEQKSRQEAEKKERDTLRQAELEAEKKAKLAEAKTDSKKPNEAYDLGGVNFGGSNKIMDIDAITIPVELNTSIVNHRISLEKSSAPISVGINLPGPRDALETFKFKASDYLRKVEITITLAGDVSDEIQKKLIDKLEAGLNLKMLAGGSAPTDWIKISKVQSIPEKKPNISSFLASLWSPDNIFISILALSIVLGCSLFCSAILLSLVVRKGLHKAANELSQGLTALKPSGAEDDKAASLEVETASANSDRKNEGSVSSQALTRELGTVRSQLAVLIQKETQACAEIIKDLISTSAGYFEFKDLLVFSGHSALQPVMDLLPQTTLEKIQIFMEENKENQPDLVNGARIAQGIYAEAIAKLSIRSEIGKVLSPIKDILINMEDETVGAFLQTASATEISILLRALSSDRSSRLVPFIPNANMKSALALLSSDFGDAKALIPELAVKLKKVSMNIVRQDQAQSRLLLKLVKLVSIQEEEQVYQLIPPTDWELKKKIFKIKILYRDIVYVPKSVIEQSFGSLPAKLKAQILFTQEGAIRDLLFATLPPGSRKRELIEQEIVEIQASEKRKNVAIESRWESIGTLMKIIRINVNKDEKFITEMISNQAAALNVSDPNQRLNKLDAA